MSARIAGLFGVVLGTAALAGVGYTQPPPAALPAVGLPALPAEPTPVIPTAPSPLVPAPQPKTVEQLLDMLTTLRKQKDELAKQEQEVIRELRSRLKEQKDRLAKLGVNAEPAPPPPVPAAGARIPAETLPLIPKP